MATERLPTRHTRELLRLKWGLRHSHREAARSLGITSDRMLTIEDVRNIVFLTNVYDAAGRVQT